MNFSHAQHQDNSKLTKVATVGLLHVALGYGIVHSLSTVHFTPPKAMEEIFLTQPEVKPPPPPPEPPKVTHKEPPKPQITIPKAEIPPPVEPQDTIKAEVQTEPAPPADPTPANTGPASDTTGPVGNIGTAVFADGCATPEYPQRALRNGDQGTTTLALLVGPDGHVQSSRVDHTSGSRDLDRAALQALSLCKFKPAIAGNGQPQAGWARLDYVWKLDG